MTAYIILNYQVDDAEQYGRYLEVAPGALQIGEVTTPIVLDGQSEAIEGDPGNQTVVLRFESADAARQAWQSDAYRDVVGLRHGATSKHLAVLVDGLD